jgi:glycosyltransferase involved in cell wall biosynthesis
MSCALPIIGGMTGGVPELVKKENGILVEPGNVERIKKAILEMKSNPERRNKMGERNRIKMVKQYSWFTIAEQYQSIYCL